MSIHRFLSACAAFFLMISQAHAFLTLPDRLIKPAFSMRGLEEQAMGRQQGLGFGGVQINPSPTPRGTLLYVPTTDGKTAIFVQGNNNNFGGVFIAGVFDDGTFKLVQEKGWDLWKKNPDNTFALEGVGVFYGVDSHKKVKIESTVPGYSGEFPVVHSVSQ